MTFGGAAHSAPSGRAGGSTKGLVRSGTCMKNARCRPSGDHASPLGGSVRRLITAVSPVSM